MSDPQNWPRGRARTRRKAQDLEAAAARAQRVKQVADAENAEFDAKTAKLRALRLAKEEAERAGASFNSAPLQTAKEHSA